jgi:ISXO2-like transposase domain
VRINTFAADIDQTVEGFYSVFKRRMKGVYQHCSEKHLNRYLSEFDFRYSNRVALGVNDVERAATALKGIVGKRLKYNPSQSARGPMGKPDTKAKKKRAKLKLSKKEQSARFIEMARELGVDETGKKFEADFVKIARAGR